MNAPHDLSIHTARLDLIAAMPASARAAANNERDRLAELLNARVPPEWPPEVMADAQEWMATKLEGDPASAGHWLWYVVAREGRVLVGSAGYTGPPRDGRIGVGYSILDAYQRRGYASEAVQALVDRAFADPAVRSIIGETFPHLTPSIGVLEKCGFAFLGKAVVGTMGDKNVMQYELTRERWRGAGPHP